MFDLFGTLVPEFSRAGFHASIDAMAVTLGADPNAFRAAWHETAIARQTGGFSDIEENVRHICRQLGVTVDAAALIEGLEGRRALYARWFHPRPGAEETLRELKERGYPIGLISMCAPDTPAMWRAGALAPWVDAEVFSCEVGLRKPDPQIYRLACERLNVAPEACLYCGDGAYGELSGASALGMTTFLIRDPDMDPADALRPEGEDWGGPAVGDLRELLAFLPRLGP